MGIQKKLIVIGFLFIFILLFTLILSSFDGSNDKDKSKIRSEDLSFLLGGSGSSGNSGTNRMGTRGEDSKSVFDTDFYESGGLRYEEEGAAPVDVTPDGEIPVNPQTGKPYPKEAMAQFDRLRELFPDNNLIPKRLTPEVKAAEEAKTQKLSTTMRSVFANNAKPDEIEYYYSNMEKQAQDRLQIIEYLIDAQGGEDEEMDKKFKDVLDGIKSQAAQIQKEKEEAYKKSGLSL
ncbi:MAG: hypothetical protein GW938_03535 [Leptospira sp.]|jgi:hypothetical protein|nr:hypothetical protein [Leptospira sp.]NCS95663.1 hypothetical protein [Leptospira sp.]